MIFRWVRDGLAEQEATPGDRASVWTLQDPVSPARAMENFRRLGLLELKYSGGVDEDYDWAESDPIVQHYREALSDERYEIHEASPSRRGSGVLLHWP